MLKDRHLFPLGFVDRWYALHERTHTDGSAVLNAKRLSLSQTKRTVRLVRCCLSHLNCRVGGAGTAQGSSAHVAASQLMKTQTQRTTAQHPHPHRDTREEE